MGLWGSQPSLSAALATRSVIGAGSSQPFTDCTFQHGGGPDYISDRGDRLLTAPTKAPISRESQGHLLTYPETSAFVARTRRQRFSSGRPDSMRTFNQLFDFFLEDSQRNVYAGQREVRPPPAPTNRASRPQRPQSGADGDGVRASGAGPASLPALSRLDMRLLRAERRGPIEKRRPRPSTCSAATGPRPDSLTSTHRRKRVQMSSPSEGLG